MEPAKIQETQPIEGTAPGSSLRVRALGAVAVTLLFVASGMFTYSFMTEGPQRAEAETQKAAQTASAEQPIVKSDAFSDMRLQAQSAYVYDLATHQELFELDPDTPRPMASMTKVAMALAVDEALSPDMRITIPYDTAAPGNPERLAAGDVWKAGDVMSFTLIASSNLGADILSEAANPVFAARYQDAPQAGSSSATVWRMNGLAKELGLSTMRFYNDNGLDESATQAGAYGSARDVARLFAYAASTSPATFSGTTKDSITFTSENGAKATALNTDLALAAIPGIIMGKTGYTDLAGGNLGIVFDVGPAHPVVAVVMGSTQDGRFTDMKKLVAATIAAIGS